MPCNRIPAQTELKQCRSETTGERSIGTAAVDALAANDQGTVNTVGKAARTMCTVHTILLLQLYLIISLIHYIRLDALSTD